MRVFGLSFEGRLRVRLVYNSLIHVTRYFRKPWRVRSSVSLSCRTMLKVPSMLLARMEGLGGTVFAVFLVADSHSCAGTGGVRGRLQVDGRGESPFALPRVP